MFANTFINLKKKGIQEREPSHCGVTSLVVETGSVVLRREVREEMLFRRDDG